MKCQTSKTSVPSLWRTACETAEQQQDSCPNHANQRPRTMPKYCLRNALGAENGLPKPLADREPQQVSCPNHAIHKLLAPLERIWHHNSQARSPLPRGRRKKTAETLLLEPTNINKNKEKACKPPGQTQEKGVWDAHAKKQNPSRFCAQAIAKPQPEKCRNVAFGTH